MAKKTKKYFGEEKAPRRAKATKAKRKYTRRAAVATAGRKPARRAGKREQLVSIQVPANVAFQLGVTLGRSLAE